MPEKWYRVSFQFHNGETGAGEILSVSKQEAREKAWQMMKITNNEDTLVNDDEALRIVEDFHEIETIY